MAFVELTRDDGACECIELNGSDMIIGRDDSAHIKLENQYVSGIHARIIKMDNGYELEDMESANGTYINGHKIENKVLLRDNDIVMISIFGLKFKQMNGTAREASETLASLQSDEQKLNKRETISPDETYLALKDKIHRLVIERMNLKRLISEETSDEKLQKITEDRLQEVIKELASEIPSSTDKQGIKKELIQDILGLGPLEDLLEDESITEVMVNSWDSIYFETEGKLHLSDRKFMDDEHVMRVIQRIVSPVGRTINESSPLVDARLQDGSRVNAIIPPLALKGPALTIRKFSKRRLMATDLLTFGSLNQSMVDFLEVAVRERRNIVISGGTGSGKTTLLNILSNFIPDTDRIITIEDVAELQLNQDHVVSLESRPPNMEGKGAITIRNLVKNCLRMRPDRIVVGECRGGEALDMLQAMNTGHDGSLTTAHANSPRDVLSRLETMVLMSGMELPLRAIREQISSAVDLIVQQSRMPDGTRKITHITEVTGMERDVILTQDIFSFRQSGFDTDGKVIGEYKAHGIIPNFVQELRQRGIKVNLEIFNSNEGGDHK